MHEQTVERFFAAIEAGDIDTVRRMYEPDAVIWHNDDLIEQTVEDNLKVLKALHQTVSGLRYEVIRRAELPDGVIQQHVLHGVLPNGKPVTLHAAMYLRVQDGRIARIDEYLDSAQRTEIRRARETLQT
jgi:ketosteroid isomerase-like protein